MSSNLNSNPEEPSTSKKKEKSSWRPHYNFYNKRQNLPKDKVISMKINDIQNQLELSQQLSINYTNSNSNSNPNTNSNNKNDSILWHLYFCEDKPWENVSIQHRIKLFEKHFINSITQYDLNKIQIQFWFQLDLQYLLSDKNFLKSWLTFYEDLIENSEMVLSCASISMHNLIIKKLTTNSSSSSSSSLSSLSLNTNSLLQTIKARIFGFNSVISLKTIRMCNYDRLVAIRGTVIRAGSNEILCTWMAFQCTQCNSKQAVKQIDGIYIQPTSCKTTHCKNRNRFEPLLTSPFTRTEAFQTIRLQESMLGENYDSGRVPRNIEIELSDDLVQTICPGDDITVTGILKAKPQQDQLRKDQANVYKMYLKAVSIANSKNNIYNKTSEFTEKDLQAIQMIKNEPQNFRLLLNSLFPTIYGHEIVKAGLLLALFGGSSLSIGKRNEIHVLVVGDPGIGKSQMLQSCANMSPRGIFICGNKSSNAGLTVSVRQEKECAGGGGALEAGALVLADQGVCCIDEFDKMSTNYQSLLEVMEQQTVSVAKAGVLCSVPARTCILAAANPSSGHYDRSKTVSENLKINPALLSRFDLVFILLDKPNTRLDHLLTSYIQDLRSGKKETSFNWSNSSSSSKIEQNKSVESRLQQSLEDKLKLLPNENIDLLPPILFQKYVAYAKKNVHPRLTPEAAEEIKKFYLTLRQTRIGLDSIPVTTRQLEGLMRLTQARARLDLSTEATIEHVFDVLEIVRYTLADVLSTADDQLQISRDINGTGVSKPKQIKRFLIALREHSNTTQKTVFHYNELKEISSINGVVNLSQIIDSLNIQGFLLKKGQNFYKFVTDG